MKTAERKQLEARIVRLANELSAALQQLEHRECESHDSPDSWPLLDNIRHTRDLAVDCQDNVNSLLAP